MENEASQPKKPLNEIPLSPSNAHTMLTRSPLHAWQENWYLGGVRPAPSDAMIRGQLIEALLFQKGLDRIVEIDAKDYKTAAAKDSKALALASNRIPVLKHQLEEWQESVKHSRHVLKQDYGITFEGCRTQLKVEWEYEGVKCKGKFDCVDDEKGIIYELKSTENAHPRFRERNITNTGQHIQALAYLEGATLKLKSTRPWQFKWLFCEPDPPYAVTVARPSEGMLELGHLDWYRAQRLWKRCIESNVWPGYATEEVALDAMTWQMDASRQAEMDQEYGGDPTRALLHKLGDKN